MTVYAGYQLEVRVAQDLDTLTGSVITGSEQGILQGIRKVTTEYGNQLSPAKNVGDRTVFDYLPGTITLSGTIERFFSGTAAYVLIKGTNESGSTMFSGGLCIYPNGAVAGQPYDLFFNTKFGDYRTSSTPGATPRTEIYDFVSTRHTTGSLQ